MSCGWALCVWQLAGFRGPHVTAPLCPPITPASLGCRSETPTLGSALRRLPDGASLPKAQRPKAGCFGPSRLPPSGQSRASGQVTRAAVILRRLALPSACAALNVSLVRDPLRVSVCECTAVAQASGPAGEVLIRRPSPAVAPTPRTNCGVLPAASG